MDTDNQLTLLRSRSDTNGTYLRQEFFFSVIPAQAGIHEFTADADSGSRPAPG